MPDISKCPGDMCPLKDHCYRFTAKDSPYAQTYLTEAPYKLENYTFTCDYIWNENRVELIKTLNSLLRGEGDK